jgi:hypothetical protein
MQTILHILEKAGGYRRDLYVRVENPPYLPLVIEATPDPGPCGLRAVSVAHYGEQNGDLMRDPEMCFEVSRPIFSRLHLYPYYYRNDYMGVEQWSRFITGDHYAYHAELYPQYSRFAVLWDKNLYVQGFLAAYERQQSQRA